MPTKMTKEEFIRRSNSIHNKYDYSLVEYKNNHTKVKIICQEHGVWLQKPNDHLNGHGCLKCSGKNKKTTKQFIEEAIEIHGNKYDYSLVNYMNSFVKIKIICSKHGEFILKPTVHINNKIGCKECGKEKSSIKRRSNTLEWTQKAIEIHGNKYDYSLVNYINQRSKIKIICKTHGVFEQTPNNHLTGQNCPLCKHNISKQETLWLDSLNISIRNKIIKLSNGTIIKPDGYDPITNTIYEYYGDYWHGNPKVHNKNDINLSNKKSFGELYEETLQREKLIKEDGYNLITIWESDAKNNV